MDKQNAELKTNEEWSKESNFYSEEEKNQIISESLMICAEALQGLKQDVAELRADFSPLNQRH